MSTYTIEVNCILEFTVSASTDLEALERAKSLCSQHIVIWEAESVEDTEVTITTIESLKVSIND